MKKWIPFIVLSCLALLSSIATVLVGIEAYLAVTGLDLLVMAKKTAPQLMLSSFPDCSNICFLFQFSRIQIMPARSGTI